MIGEPEVQLHPGLERLMYAYLAEKSRDVQMFIATHSTNFVDVSMAQNIYLVSRSADVLSTITKLASQDEVLRIPDEIGLRPSTFFMFHRLAFLQAPPYQPAFP